MSKRILALAVLLAVSPIAAFAVLALVHPIGDPSRSPSFWIRLLDYQGTYAVRNAVPIPPPLLVLGVLLAGGVFARDRSKAARIVLMGTGAVLALWFFVFTLVPALLHVN